MIETILLRQNQELRTRRVTQKTPVVPSHASIAPSAEGGAAINDAQLDALVALESRNDLEVEQLFGRPASANHALANFPAHVRLPAQSD